MERYNRHTVNPKVEFNEARKSTTLICDVKGAKEGSWYDFDWFLRPWDLDFIDSHFEKREKELYWQGKVEGVKYENWGLDSKFDSFQDSGLLIGSFASFSTSILGNPNSSTTFPKMR